MRAENSVWLYIIESSDNRSIGHLPMLNTYSRLVLYTIAAINYRVDRNPAEFKCRVAASRIAASRTARRDLWRTFRGRNCAARATERDRLRTPRWLDVIDAARSRTAERIPPMSELNHSGTEMSCRISRELLNQWTLRLFTANVLSRPEAKNMGR